MATPGSTIDNAVDTAREADTRYDYELAFDNAIVGVCFMENRRFVHVNRRMEEIFGYSAEELTGRSVRLLYASNEEYEAVGRMYPSLARNHRYSHEKPMIRKDGEIIWCTISGRAMDPLDPLATSVWIVQDITERKLVEKQLERSNQRLEQTIKARTLNLQRTNKALVEEVERRRTSEHAMLESREKYRALFRSIPAGIVITDKAGRIVEANRAMQTLTGTTTFDDLLAAANDASRVVLRSGESASLHAFIAAATPPDGRRIEHAQIGWRSLGNGPSAFAVVAVRLHVAGLGAAFTFEDTSERERARQREQEQQDQLAHAGRLALMGQFASTMAHELGQPLNACQSYIAGLNHRLDQWVGRDSIDPAQLREGLTRIARHIEQASNVVRNVRGFVARTRPEAEPVDLAQLVAQTLDLLESQLRNAGVRVEVAAPAAVPPVEANPTEIQQVLVNLIVNAIEAMRDNAASERVIEIRIASARTRVSIQLSDNGPGVTRDLAEKIFEPYFTTKQRGLGLGLMICRTLVEAHGGTLKLVDKTRGAAFKFTLPKAECE